MKINQKSTSVDDTRAGFGLEEISGDLRKALGFCNLEPGHQDSLLKLACWSCFQCTAPLAYLHLFARTSLCSPTNVPTPVRANKSVLPH